MEFVNIYTAWIAPYGEYDEDIDTLLALENIWYLGCFITMTSIFRLGYYTK